MIFINNKYKTECFLIKDKYNFKLQFLNKSHIIEKIYKNLKYFSTTKLLEMDEYDISISIKLPLRRLITMPCYLMNSSLALSSFRTILEINGLRAVSS